MGLFNKNTEVLEKTELFEKQSDLALVGLTGTVDALTRVSTNIGEEISGLKNTVIIYNELIEKAQSDIQILEDKKLKNEAIVKNIKGILEA